jgi:O-antigen ligase
MAFDGWKQHPILGVGIGGIPRTIAEHSTAVYKDRPMNQVRMIHSTYIQVLAETGLIGALLFAGFMISFFRRALAVVREDPVRITAFGACVVWFVAAAFDGYQQSGGFLTVGAICMALATMPGASAEQPRTGADSDH